MLLVKPMCDPLAWAVQKMLRQCYFTVREQKADDLEVMERQFDMTCWSSKMAATGLQQIRIDNHLHLGGGCPRREGPQDGHKN